MAHTLGPSEYTPLYPPFVRGKERGRSVSILPSAYEAR